MRPPGRGIGCLIESVEAGDLANRTRDLLLAVGHLGLAGLEFKEDPRDGRLKLLDLNPRWGQGDSLAALCGIDMAWLYYSDALGAETPGADSYRTGVKWVQLRSYLRAAVAAQRERRVGLLRSILNLRGELHHSVLAWDDVRPAAWTLWDLTGGRFSRRRRSLHATARTGGAPDRDRVSTDARDGDSP
jgi:predicted ATP-grasp superfamily ATP-dependent carboligase